MVDKCVCAVQNSMYSNIPPNELIHIIEKISQENTLDDTITKELIRITRTVIDQNYFTFQNQNYSQKTGLAMGAPSSAILSEIYWTHQ